MNKNFYNPYTFIPLPSKVFLLNENEEKQLQSVHDIPFTDGISGTINFDFKALSPICIKHSENDESINLEDQFFIPGSSIKGMIRNVFEILSFSNIRNYIANSRYSMRDLRSSDYELKANDKPQKSGLLIQLNNRFYVIKCNSDKYNYKEIAEIESLGENEIKNEKTVKGKYQKLKDGYIFQDKDNEKWKLWFFSGFMNNKKNEYLFDIPEIKENKLIPLEEKEYKEFIFIHQQENENEAWKFWKKILKNYRSIDEILKDEFKGIVPCFFRTKEVDGKVVVKDLGFSYLYRQPYNNTIHSCLPKEYYEDGVDLTQAVFGYSSGHKSLKGRVQFSPAFIKDAQLGQRQTFIMGKPKPTFYPFYLKQNKQGALSTYFSNEAQISGWKRYIIHQNHFIGITTGKKKVETTFIPIAENTKFSCKIKFHNLRPFELGALIVSLTYNGKQNECYHTLGFAKAKGYGKIKLEKIDIIDGNTCNSLIQTQFTKAYFDKFSEKGISEKDFQITANELQRIASGNYKPSKEIRYPDLNSKEFEQIKNEKLSLRDFKP